MKFEIHPDAIGSFNQQAADLVDVVKLTPRPSRSRESFATDIHVPVTITDKDIVGELKESLVDYRGNAIGRYFQHESSRYSLENKDHEKLSALAEKIQRLPAFRDRISQKYIEDNLFEWIEASFKEKEVMEPYIESLISDALKIVTRMTVIVPIAYTSVQESFTFCSVLIKNLSKDDINSLEKEMFNRAREEVKENLGKFFEELRVEYQGFATAQLSLECEYGYANELAINLSQRAVNLLSIYSGAALFPDIKSLSKVKGTEHLSKTTLLFLTEENGLTTKSGILDKASAKQWPISSQDLKYFRSCGLDILSDLATKSKRTDFETTVLNSISIYSKASLTAEPLEKLVYTLSALETALLKNENEPIQQNLAERIALVIGEDLEHRKNIVKSVRKVYGIRSKYLHHGNSTSELEEMTVFFRHVWIFFVTLLGCARNYSSKAKFLEAIDDEKLG